MGIDRHPKASINNNKVEEHHPQPQQNIWAIVLAGGDGTRARSFLNQVCGAGGLKQFSAIIGRRSMLQHTVARAERLIDSSRILVSLNNRHRDHALPQLAALPLENLIFQPKNIDTAAGILLPLAHITRRDPTATIVVFPSDHFILDESKFLECVQSAAMALRYQPEALVLLGLTPDSPDESYGWVEPAAKNGPSGLKEVHGFHEKPAPQKAEQLMLKGCLWNTFVLVSQAQTLWDIVSRIQPKLYHAFRDIHGMLGHAHAQFLIDHTYDRLKPVNFSSEILAHATPSLRTLQVPDIGWSDWGTRERILSSLKAIGRYGEFLSRYKSLRRTSLSATGPRLQFPLTPFY